ncbi:MAG: 50S ribosomal protein L5 [Gemmatimonas sp. SG8_23]|nr:MAG: 50S ribosomal protein L5 [Gemmatimonas sp. SG8_23]
MPVDKIQPRLKTHYETHVRPKLQEEFQFTNPHQVPKLLKIVLNVGVGEAAKDQKLLESVIDELGVITGQKANMNRARKSISNFQLREGMPVGASVTLRRDRMWFFLDRLISTAVPRIRDFRGLPSRSFDGRGNYTMGIREQIIFPEINFDDVKKIHGMDITFVTSTDKDDEGFALLRELGMPFRGEVPVQIGATA